MYVESVTVPPAVLEYAEELMKKATRHIDEAEWWVHRATNGSHAQRLIADAMLTRADRSLTRACAAIGMKE